MPVASFSISSMFHTEIDNFCGSTHINHCVTSVSFDCFKLERSIFVGVLKKTFKITVQLVVLSLPRPQWKWNLFMGLSVDNTNNVWKYRQSLCRIVGRVGAYTQKPDVVAIK